MVYFVVVYVTLVVVCIDVEATTQLSSTHYQTKTGSVVTGQKPFIYKVVPEVLYVALPLCDSVAW